MEFIGLEKVREGKYLKNYELTYLNKLGNEKKFEIVSMRELQSPSDLGKSAVGISIVATCGNKLLLLHEFRLGVNRRIYNLCAGMVEDDETIENCIKRELYEETGLSVVQIKKILPASFQAVALSDIKAYLAFVEVSGTITGENASANEDIEANFYTKEEVLHLIETEEFSSRAQIAAYLFTQI